MIRFWLSRTFRLTVIFVSFLAGLALARKLAVHSFLVVLGLIMLVCLCRRSQIRLVLLIAAACLAGLTRGHVFMMQLSKYQRLFHKQVTIVAVADSDAVYADKGQLTFDVNHPQLQTPSKQNLAGKIHVSGLGANMIYRGDTVRLAGSLLATKGSNQAKMSFAKIVVLKKSSSVLDGFRRRFITGLQSTLPEPEASFGAGLLIGQRSTIPTDVSNQLSVTGLTHLVAVSGYNLTIIIVAVRRLLGRASKFQSTATAGLLIVLFVLITGFSASIVRAALVTSLSLITWYYGRRVSPLVLITLAAAVTAAWNPFYLWSDVGWYLSFLAFFGVLLLAPQFSQLGRRAPKLIGGLLAETTSAQLMTLPIIMFIFGRLSLIGLLANMLVVPLVPLAMLGSLVAGLGGMTFVAIGGWIAIPARWLLTYMIDIVGLLSRVPHASAQKQIPLSTMLELYGCLLLLTVILSLKKPRQKPENMIK